MPVNEMPKWDEFVDSTPGGTLFHSYRWMEPLKPVVHVIEDSSGICSGLLCCPRKRYGVAGFHLPPYTPLQGPIVRQSSKANYSSAIAEERKWLMSLLESIEEPSHIDLMIDSEFVDFPAYDRSAFQSSLWITHEVNMPLEAWMANLPSNMRSKLRKLKSSLEKGDIEIRCKGRASDILDLAEATSRLKKYDMRRSILETLMRSELENDLWSPISIVKDGETIGGSILFHDHNRGWNVVNGVRRDLDDHLRWTNVLVMYACISFCFETNRIFDFEGSLLPGVEDFYRMLGGRKRLIARLQKSNNYFFRLLRAVQYLKG